MKKILLLSIYIGIVLTACTQKNDPKYVFLFIGDGMGVNQVNTTEMFLSSDQGVIRDTQLLFNTFPVSSNMTTYSANRHVTCSSAAATAMATGNKTNNGVLGKSPDLEIAYESIADKAGKAGYKVGIVSSVSIDHATPAGFYATQDSREMYYNISLELPESGFDYFGGGGFKNPKGRNRTLPDAYENAQKNGYILANTSEKIQDLKNGDEKVFAVNPVLLRDGSFPYAVDRKEGSVSLADFTRKGIDVLDNEKGFFMMVEGGKIDWACHANDIVSSIYEVLAFNDAIEVAYDFYEDHPDETLIIVTADHETGALFSGMNYVAKPELLKYQKISKQAFKSKIWNLKQSDQEVTFNDIKAIIEENFGLGNDSLGLGLTADEENKLKIAYNNEFENKIDIDPNADYKEVYKFLNIVDVTVEILTTKAHFGWGSTGHSGMPVPVRAIGAGQQEFSNYFDNTDLPKKIAKLMEIKW